jgi:hypothetical protein
LRRLVLLCFLLATLAFGWFGWRNFASRPQTDVAAAPNIAKQPIVVANRTFDPLAPPVDMPPVSIGEEAVCDSRFLSDAKVAGVSRQADATHATLTITQVAVTLQLNVTIWAPTGATQHVLEHEDGHRQISEYYYQGADKIAARVAATYLGRQVELVGADLNAESSKALQQMAMEITDEYNKELNPEPAQALYDRITDHSRNESNVRDAVAAAIRESPIASILPPPARTL